MRQEILIDSATPEIRVALLEDDRLTELFVERPGGGGVMGNVYRGRVSSVLPGMQSAFVTIGLERDAFLYVEDVLPPDWDEDAPARGAASVPADPAAAAASPSGGPPPPFPRIEDLLREGQELVVQITKDPIGQKGARITTHVALPGRFLVYLPTSPHVGVSRKIEDAAERDRLRDEARTLVADLGLPGGCIVRTVGAGRDAQEFRGDAAALGAAWESIRRLAETRPAPSLLHEEPGAVGRVLRDVLNDDVERVLADAPAVRDEAAAFVARVQPALLPRIALYEGREPIFEAHGVEPQIEKALRPRVWLKSGGSIVIHQTEALVAIDVNTGKYVGTRTLEDTILTTNLEAAREIARQLRLRDLGGIIVIDFIDMQEADSRERLVQALGHEMRRDRAKWRLQPISAFGLVEITRQRTKRSLERILCRPCPACGGAGRTKSPETVTFEILRAIGRQRGGRPARLVIRANPEVAACLAERRAAGGGPADELAHAEIRPDPALAIGAFSLETG